MLTRVQREGNPCAVVILQISQFGKQHGSFSKNRMYETKRLGCTYLSSRGLASKYEALNSIFSTVRNNSVKIESPQQLTVLL